jgi:hypothetical protein
MKDFIVEFEGLPKLPRSIVGGISAGVGFLGGPWLVYLLGYKSTALYAFASVLVFMVVLAIGGLIAIKLNGSRT